MIKNNQNRGWELDYKAMDSISLNGAGSYPEGICKICPGIGNCKHGKTDEEFIVLKKKLQKQR